MFFCFEALGKETKKKKKKKKKKKSKGIGKRLSLLGRRGSLKREGKGNDEVKLKSNFFFSTPRSLYKSFVFFFLLFFCVCSSVPSQTREMADEEEYADGG